MKKLTLLLAIFIASPLMGQNANTPANQAARQARRQAANPAVAQETAPATPAVAPVAQETNSTEVKKTEKKPIKSIFSLNYTMGGHDVSFFYEYKGVDTNLTEVNFQMGGNMEYILGKQWHWYLGVGALSLNNFNLSIHTGFGVTFVDTRNAEGLGWMFDWNILTVGTAVSQSGKFGLMGTTNIRARYSMSKYFGIQVGWDFHMYWLEYDMAVDSSPSSLFTSNSIEVYSGFNFGLAFGR